MIDLRSDTVTRPTPAMRAAMAAAEVGDDVYEEDPTVRRLEELAASMLGKEAALFVPTGTMGNQIAIHLQTRPGSEVVLEARAHIFNFEMGAMAVWSGVIPRPVTTADGLLTPEQVASAIAPPVSYRTPTRLLCLENTHNLWSGLPMDEARTRALAAVAHGKGVPVHLDGARIFNAAIALGTSAAALAAPCDTVMCCLSKGLAAPVGSLLAGPTDLVREGRRVRKLFGGGMRQVGVLAAPGIVALTDMVDRLGEDHARARRLAEGLAGLPGVEVDPRRVWTNILVFRLQPASGPEPPAPRLAAGLRERGILCIAFSDHELRMVTHVEISDADIHTTLAAAADVLTGLYS
ncbi:MAG TPA: GntG family PLP-dependent aldolase [Thermoanaerobaculaceae bacterium]|nr:GntG family PLP-dependent aldolase [Thermoanaerobaculaceae bacterium]HRS15816.1 GntG family PLP-dependent aldolase [Thermoanaerobaculaceae bacterium]